MTRNCGAARKRGALTSAALATALVVSACGDDAQSADAAEGLPETVKLVSINPTTGVIAFAGEGANKGYELAVKEINDTDFLEGTELQLDLMDTKSEPQMAAQHMTKVSSDEEVTAVFGSVSSNEAVAMSPLAEQAQLPTLYTQSGSDGVVIGDYTWRSTPLMSQYYPLLNDYVKETGAKSVGIIYTMATPTLQEIGQETLPAMAAELGLEVTAELGTQATTQDYSALISQILRDDPDLVSILLAGAANATAMTQLRQAGYDGPVLGNVGAGAGNLDPAGQDGVGMVWAANWHPDMEGETTQEFVELYEEEYGEEPLNFAAEAYDTAWFVAKALKEAGSADRTAVKDAMHEIAEEPFDGALGEGLVWVDQDLQVPGAVVEKTADDERMLYQGESPTAG